MEALSNSTSLIISNDLISFKSQKPQIPITVNLRLSSSKTKHSPRNLFSSSSSSSSFTYGVALSSTASTSTPTTLSSHGSSERRHWMVLMEAPKPGLSSKQEVVDYYVRTLERVLPSDKEAQMCIYDASFGNHFGFCCDIDEQASLQLSGLPDVLSVKPDPDFESAEKNYDPANAQSNQRSDQELRPNFLFPPGTTKHWLVQMDKPRIGVVTKAQMVDFYSQILAKVLGNEKDAQMCIYHIAWQNNFGFCCELDEDCAKELAGVPGVLSVQLDKNFDSKNKDYGGSLQSSTDQSYSSSEASETTPIKTRKLFITGLSFYTSEKTLRAAFEGFGKLVEVKIIMDKISKRSKGYAFIEYATEEAASEALKEMNGKIINGWMIVVDVAKPSSRPSKRIQS